MSNGNMITVSEVPGCSQPPPITTAEYTASATEVTIWATIMVMSFNVDVEATFTKQ